MYKLSVLFAFCLFATFTGQSMEKRVTRSQTKKLTSGLLKPARYNFHAFRQEISKKKNNSHKAQHSVSKNAVMAVICDSPAQDTPIKPSIVKKTKSVTAKKKALTIISPPKTSTPIISSEYRAQFANRTDKDLFIFYQGIVALALKHHEDGFIPLTTSTGHVFALCNPGNSVTELKISLAKNESHWLITHDSFKQQHQPLAIFSKEYQASVFEIGNQNQCIFRTFVN